MCVEYTAEPTLLCNFDVADNALADTGQAAYLADACTMLTGGLSPCEQIKNRQILEYMISNCSNIFILMDRSDEHKRIGDQAYKLYEELGFPYDEVRYIVNKYMYRTDI